MSKYNRYRIHIELSACRSVDCSVSCLHGNCAGQSCTCHYGWEGDRCDEGENSIHKSQHALANNV